MANPWDNDKPVAQAAKASANPWDADAPVAPAAQKAAQTPALSPTQAAAAPLAPEEPSWLQKAGQFLLRNTSPEAQFEATTQLVTGLPRATARAFQGVGGIEQLVGEHPLLSTMVAPGINPEDLAAAGKATQAYYSTVSSGQQFNPQTAKIETPTVVAPWLADPKTELGKAGRLTGDVVGTMVNLAAGGEVGQLAGLAPKAINLAMAGGFGAQAAGERYGQARAEGATPEQATKEAAISGTLNAGLGLVPGAEVTGGLGRQLLVRGTRAAGLGTVSTIGENLASRIHRPDTGLFEGLPENVAGFVGVEGAHGLSGLISPERGYKPSQPLDDPRIQQIAGNAEQQLTASGMDTATARQVAQSHALEINDQAKQKGLDPLELERQSPLTTTAPDGTPIEVAPTERRAQGQRAQQIRDLVGKRNTEGLSPDEAAKLSDLLEADRNQAKIGTRDIEGVGSKQAYLDQHDAGKLKPIQVFTDLDNFKRINDTFGHATGDQAILAFGKALNDKFGQGNVFHLSGDEFVAHVDTPEQADQLMQAVRDEMGKFKVKGKIAGTEKTGEAQGVGLSYGKAPISDHVDEAGNPVPYHDAEIAQYADKEARKQAGLRFERGEAPPLVAGAPAVEEPVSPRLTKFRYMDQSGAKQEVPIETPEHQAELASILDQHDKWMNEIRQIPGDDASQKALRARLYKQVSDDRARALQDLHFKIQDEAVNGPAPKEPAGIDAPDNTPAGQQARTELADLTDKAINLPSTNVDPLTQDVGQQYENARTQAAATRAALLPIARMAERISPADQRALMDYVESKGKTPLAPWLQKWADEVVMPLTNKLTELYREAGKVTGEGSHEIDDPEVGYVPRHYVEPTNPPTLANRFARWMGFHGAAPGQEPSDFVTGRGLPTGDTVQKHREYYVMTTPDGKREVVSLSNAGKVAQLGEDGRIYRRKNLKQLIQDRLAGPQAAVDRARQKALDTYDSIMNNKPDRLERQADVLAGQSKVLGDVVKKLARVSDMNEGRATRELLEKRDDLESARKAGDMDYAMRRDPALRKMQADFEDAVESKLNAPLDALEKRIAELNGRLEKETKPALKQRYEQQLGDLSDQRVALEDQIGNTDFDQFVAEDKSLTRRKLDLQDAYNKYHETETAKVDGQLKAIASRVARNEGLRAELEQKAAEAEQRSIQNNTEAQMLRERFDHLQPDEAMKALASEEAGRPINLNGEKREPRMTAALTKLDKAQADYDKAARDLSYLKDGDRVYTDAAGNIYRMGQAKAGEIEAATGKRIDPYYLMNLLYHYDRMSQVVRNLKLINDNWTPYGQPRFDEHGNELPVPKGYARTDLQAGGLNKLYFPEPVARMLDHLAEDIRRSSNPDSLANAVKNVTGLMVRSIFYNPLMHMGNTAVHYTKFRGWRNINPAEMAQTPKALVQAFNDIAHLDPDVLDWANHGLRMMSWTEKGSEFRDALDARLKDQLKSLRADDPKVIRLARAIGQPVQDVLGGIYKHASNALWLADDMMRLETARYLEKSHPDWSREEIVKKVNEGIAHYQSYKNLPVAVRKVVENPALFMFGRYHQFLIADTLHDMKNSVLPKPRMSETGRQLQSRGEVYAEHLGRIGTLAVMMAVMRPAVSALAQKVYEWATGKHREDIKLRPMGAMSLPANLMSLAADTEVGQKAIEKLGAATSPEAVSKLYEGPKSPYEVAQSVFTPTPLARVGAELMGGGRDAYSGRRLSGAEMAQHALGALAPVGQAIQLAGGRQTPGGFGLSQVGLSFKGTPAMVAAKKAVADTYSTGAMTDEDRASMQAKAALRAQAAGLPAGPGGALTPDQNKLIQDAVKGGNITQAQAIKIVKEANLPPEQQLAREVEKLRGGGAPEAAMQIWRLATPEERKAIQPEVAKILSRTQNKTGAQAARIRELYNEFSRTARNAGQ